jgi:hypothetical protein
MKESIRRSLDGRRSEIRSRWTALLKLEKPASPLADPDILLYLFDRTLDEVLSVQPASRRPSPPPASRCACNPLQHYFSTLEQALLETLVWVQAEEPTLTAEERVASVGGLCARLRRVARRELGLLDSFCPHLAKEPRQT